MLRLAGRDILAMFDKMGERYGDVSTLKALNSRLVVLRGADAARHVLVTNQDNYPKGEQYELFRPVLGDGLVTSSGEPWRAHRKLVQPMFAKRHLTPFADHMAAAAQRAVDAWDERWVDGAAIDVNEEMLRVGIDTVSRALASADITEEQRDLFEAGMVDSLKLIGRISRHPLVFLGQDLPGVGIMRAAKLAQSRNLRHLNASGARAHDVIRRVVDDRARHGHGERSDLVRLLMETRDEDTGALLTHDEVVDELVTFVSAGHETTAGGLAWMFHLLAEHHDARARFHEEIDTVLQGQLPSDDAAERLPWVTACFQEAMRLIPPVWHIPRVAAADDEIGGFHIPAGSRILISIWSTHRDPNVWDDPLTFDPSRWLNDAHKDRPRFSYLPFGGGRRACIGQGFALMNAAILAAMIGQRFVFENADDQHIVLEPTITLRPRDGIAMRAHRRAPSIVAA